MDLFTRIAKKNYKDRGFGAGGYHAEEMMEKEEEMPFPNGRYIGKWGTLGIISLFLITILGFVVFGIPLVAYAFTYWGIVFW